MPKISLQVDEGWYKSDSSPLLNRECKNLYPSVPQARGGSSSGGLFSFPGLEFITDLGLTVNGYYVSGSDLYIVGTRNAKDGIFKIDSSYTVTNIGDLTGYSGSITQVEIDSNGVVLAVLSVDKKLGWFVDLATDTVTAITDATFVAYQTEADGVESVAYVDGRFVYCTKETVFWGSLSTTNSGQDFDALSFLKPFLRDSNVRVANVRGDLVVFGQDQTKFFGTTADQDLPYQEIPGATIDKGLAYRDAFCEFDGSYFFAGGGIDERISIWRGVGSGSVTKVSTDAIDREIQDRLEGNSIISNIGFDRFLLNGNPVVLVKLFGFSATSEIFAYNVLASSIKQYPTWFRVRFTDFTGIRGVRFFEFNNRITCQNGSSSLYYLNYEQSDYGFGNDNAPKIFSSAYLQGQSDNQIINRLELVMETGTGNDPDTALDNRNILVQMEYSDDGSRTWVDCGTKSAGNYQQFEKRVIWTQLGLSPTSRIFRFTTTTDLAVRFHRIDLDLQGSVRNV